MNLLASSAGHGTAKSKASEMEAMVAERKKNHVFLSNRHPESTSRALFTTLELFSWNPSFGVPPFQGFL